MIGGILIEPNILMKPPGVLAELAGRISFPGWLPMPRKVKQARGSREPAFVSLQLGDDQIRGVRGDHRIVLLDARDPIIRSPIENYGALRWA